MSALKLDFEDEELQFRQEIWHERVTRLFKLLSQEGQAEIPERVNADHLRQWLEDGNELELVNDKKFEKLNETVDDLDWINRALKMCITQEEVDLLEKQENQGLIDISLMVRLAKERIKRGELPKFIQKGRSAQQGIAYLKNAREKVKQEDGNDYGVKDTEMDNQNQEEEEEDTDLDDEKEESEGGTQSKKTKKKSSASGDAKKRVKKAGDKSKPKLLTPNKKPLMKTNSKIG